MDQVSRRLRLIGAVASGAVSTGDESANAEFACLQLRKALEQVAYAGLAASRERYAEVRPQIDREWRATKILERLAKIHPGFYPQPVAPVRRGPNRWHCDPVVDGFLTCDEFVFLYDKCSDVVHDWNPFREGPRVVELQRSVADWAARIERLLEYHLIRLVDQRDVLLVQLVGDAGKARVLTGSPHA
jgi:hypothetical protein